MALSVPSLFDFRKQNVFGVSATAGDRLIFEGSRKMPEDQKPYETQVWEGFEEEGAGTNAAAKMAQSFTMGYSGIRTDMILDSVEIKLRDNDPGNFTCDVKILEPDST